MGSAQSQNVASAVADVANFVSNSTIANVSQAEQIQNSAEFINCNVELKGNLTDNNITNVIQQSTQIASAKNDASVANNIQQQMLQEATSQVGMLGIGFANASNSCSEMVNASSNISNAMTTSASQFESINSDFICDNSTIIANNINIGFTNTGSMIANQTLNNDQVANITNNISQTVTQKATATVQGIGSFLILIVIIIAIIVWGVTRTLSSGGVRVAVTIILLIATAGILSFMYIKSTPPFFAEPSKCLKNCPIGLGQNDCINYSDNEPYRISAPPLRYSVGLTPSTSKQGGNLLQMAIASASGQTSSNIPNNGGYNMKTLNTLTQLIHNYDSIASRLGISNIPNPLFDSSTLLQGATGWLGIPVQYLPIPSSGQNGSTSAASCTPMVLQVQVDAPAPAGCVSTMDPSHLSQIPKTGDGSLALANLNDSAFDNYLVNGSGDSQTRTLFARFVLCDILNIQPLNIYVQAQEPIRYMNGSQPAIGLPSDSPNTTYLFQPDSLPGNYANAIEGGGVLVGPVGVVNDTQYRFNNFMSNIGKWILLALVIIAVICIFWTWFFTPKKDGSSSLKKEKSVN